MANKSKAKGSAYERELVENAKLSGLDSVRAWGSDGRSLGHAPEVDLLIDGKKVQAKRRKDLPSWCDISNVDAVAFREDRGSTRVLVSWKEYIRLLLCERILRGLGESLVPKEVDVS